MVQASTQDEARRRRPPALAVLAAVRPRQCLTKNILIYAALVFAFRLTDPVALTQATVAFVLFALVSGVVYLFNDLQDVEQDRLHPGKRYRPIATGELSATFAWVLIAGIAPLTLGVAVALRPPLGMVLGLYLAAQIGYSLGLKHQVLLDVFLIAAGFVLRAVAGGVAIRVPISPWLYVCTALGALFLGFAKRRAEIMLLAKHAGQHRRVLEEYSAPLLDKLLAIVVALTVMAYALYTFSAENLPANHAMMLTIPFVLYGIFRYLYLVYHLDEGGSPEVLLLADTPLLTCILLWGLTSIAILYYPWG